MHLVRQPLLITGLVALASLAALATACGGSNDSDLAELNEVVEHLQEIFIDQEKLTPEEVTQAAIDGILEYLDDPYTSYLTPEQYENFDRSLSGEGEEFEGIGAEVTMRDGRLMVIGPLPGSPASKAGIRPGDLVLNVDGQSLEGFELLDAVNLIRGERGTPVVLRILRLGALVPVDVTIIRDTIELTSVSARIQEDGIGYIHLAGFDAATAEGLREAIEGLREDGVQGLILDLRNNTGGLVEASVDVASEFLEEDLLIFVWRNADGSEREFKAKGDGTAYDIPLVVIVNAFSASASEIVTGALKDHGRATIVGTRTFGKGSVNILEQLDSGAGLYVTTARWLTPNGLMIEGQGLEPDVVVGDYVDVQAAQRIGSLMQSLCQAYDEESDSLGDRETLTEALDGLCGLGSQEPLPDQEDEQLDAAVKELRRVMAR